MYRRSTKNVRRTPDEPRKFEREKFEKAPEKRSPDKEEGTLRRSIAEPPVVATSD